MLSLYSVPSIRYWVTGLLLPRQQRAVLVAELDRRARSQPVELGGQPGGRLGGRKLRPPFRLETTAGVFNARRQRGIVDQGSYGLELNPVGSPFPPTPLEDPPPSPPEKTDPDAKSQLPPTAATPLPPSPPS